MKEVHRRTIENAKIGHKTFNKPKEMELKTSEICKYEALWGGTCCFAMKKNFSFFLSDETPDGE